MIEFNISALSVSMASKMLEVVKAEIDVINNCITAIEEADCRLYNEMIENSISFDEINDRYDVENGIDNLVYNSLKRENKTNTSLKLKLQQHINTLKTE